ncbi:hypothetical protein AUR64_10950 [Haloprofundus marisrubri]|uniref:Uncharacterized protein n=1 Tax=Haloprofundus marisrubri TaxID=1514971 RepID=A0A0W1R9Y7_9EURY|nr:hypothetical protein [Haloprofundus marisrubri]KTG10106.1 hypothetical protein AUR64_10950 [Haloprofundus marisrubri]
MSASTEKSTLAPVRTGRYAEFALVVATVVGLAATAVHWAGLLVGGVLVGLVATSLSRAVVNGLTFGLVVLVAFAAWLLYEGGLETALQTGQIGLLTVAVAFVLPLAAAVAVRALV